MKTEYRNRLPHLAPIGASFFVTFRQYDALPQSLVKQLKKELATEIAQIKKEAPAADQTRRIAEAKKRSFGKHEKQLDYEPYGSCHLRKPEVARLLIDRVKKYDGSLIDLHAMCVMPNHVHLLFSMSPQMLDEEGIWRNEMPEDYVQLNTIMQYIKGGSSRKINEFLRTPKQRFWAKDSFDHYVRNDEEWLRIVHYILQNPVKASLVSEWSEWPHTLVQKGVLKVYNALF